MAHFQQDEKASKDIELAKFVVELAPPSMKGLVMHIGHKSKHYYVKFDTPSSLDDWMATLQAVSQHSQEQESAVAFDCAIPFDPRSKYAKALDTREKPPDSLAGAKVEVAITKAETKEGHLKDHYTVG